jgi:DivIVA domain-containing protein
MAEAPQPKRAVRQRPSRHRTAVDRVRSVNFPLVLRGYDRRAVDEHLAQIAQLVAELEATQLRDNVVQRALDEVGEQTSSILQRAHETAEEIAARSRSQAEGRIQRAEREAALTRQEADKYSEQVVQDTRRLWEERRRLIEDMRQFAEDVLGVADDAFERLPEAPPEPLRPGQPEPSPAAEDQTVQLEAAEPAAEPAEGPAEQPAEQPAPQPAPEPPPQPAAEPPRRPQPPDGGGGAEKAKERPARAGTRPVENADPIESVRRIERVERGTPGRDAGG